MLRKALQGAAVAGAAAALAAGAASPAMAGGDYYEYEHEFEYNANDYGGVNILSNLCLDVSDVVDVIDLDVLTQTGGNTCDFVNSETHNVGNDVDLDDDHDWHGHK